MPEHVRKARRPPGRFERRILILACALTLSALLAGAALVWLLLGRDLVRSLLVAALVVGLCVLLVSLLTSAFRPLRALTSVVEAYRDGDYTIRSNREFADDAFGDLVREVNSLGDTLLAQRLRATEATALLEKLIAAIDPAVLAFDGDGQLRLFNPAALQLLGLQADTATGRRASELGVAELLTAEGGAAQLVTSIGGRVGRWQVIHGTFRDEGLAQHLLIISDLRQVLREEERGAWQRLIRVVGHEINNSLAPVKSIAGTLHELLNDALPAGRLREDALPALQLIADRMTTLQRFLAQYSRLARLPAPRRRWIRLTPLVMRVAALGHPQPIEVVVPDDLEIHVDEDQLEQALINLVRNAIEANGAASGRVTVVAQRSGTTVRIVVTDAGPGITNADNLFVPFFTTKPGGSGTGLLLSRQVAEAHGGMLSLGNRVDAAGAIATLELPDSTRGSA